MKKNPNVPYHSLELPRVILVCVYLAVCVWYLTYRLTTFNPDAMVFSLLVYGAELFGFTTTLLHLFMVWRLTEREAPEPREGQTVDVFITTINEPISMIRRTALCALAMDYPHKVWILDDGRRAEMKQLAGELGCGYISRENNEHAKAGNLNNALKMTSGDFIAIFDADHAPKRNFITRTLGYFEDPKVAFVQTPQDFYNLDSYQHRANKNRSYVWTEQSLFFRVIQRGKDFWNSAFFCGSCALVRRSSLQHIGGFATATVTEDLHTSLRLHKAGYKSVYHSESLAFGIAPAQIEPFIKQRIRWGQGAMQVWRKEGLFYGKGLSMAQRFNYFASMLTYFDGWQKFIFYIAPVIVLTTGTLPIIALTQEFFLHFVPFFLLTFWVFEEVGRGYGRSLHIEQYNMARYFAFAYATLGLFRKNLKFNVTNKKLVGLSAHNILLLPQYGILVLNTLAIPAGILLYIYYGHINTLTLAANAFWAAANLLLANAVVLFTLGRAHFRRENYRFSVPLVASVEQPDGQILYGAIDDISSGGFMIFLESQRRIKAETRITGELFLPDGSVPYEAEIHSVTDALSHRTQVTGVNLNRATFMLAIGCEFIWKKSAVPARDQLELFLYGSDLEWHIQNLSERMNTPLEKLFPRWLNEKETLLRIPSHWSSMLCWDAKEPEAGIRSGVLAFDPASRQRSLVVFSPLKDGMDVETSIFTGKGWRTMRGTIGKHKTLANAASNLYVYPLDNAAAIA